MTTATDQAEDQMDEQEAEALSFLQPDETAAQLLSRCHVESLRTGLAFIDGRSPLRPGCFVEIGGLAGTGKTEILYSVSAWRMAFNMYECCNYSTCISSTYCR